MFLRRKKKVLQQTSVRWTGVSAILTADHRDQSTGEIHSHVWEITAWRVYDGTDHRALQRDLAKVLERHQGKCLPDRIAWAEPMAEHIGRELNAENDRWDAPWTWLVIEVARPDIRHIARWEK